MRSRGIQNTMLAALLAVGSALYGQSNTVPYQETFEGLADGSNIIAPGNTNGWYSGTNTVSAFVTNVSYAWTNTYPVESTTHSNVLKFTDASLTNRFAAYLQANTTVDFMAQAVRTTAVPDSNQVAGNQTSLYLDTNGLLNVRYGIDNSGTNNAWQKYTHTAVGTADWVRITIELDYTTDPSNRFFKVSLNGAELQPSTNGYLKGSGTFTADPNGIWLRSASQAVAVQSFSAVGTGMLDDLVVKTAPAEQYTTNGTPHSWLDQYGLTNYVADDVLDQDNDGLKTWQEYIAGTVPTNPASVFKAAQAVRNVVTWSPVVTGRVYSVHWSTNLVKGFTNLADNATSPHTNTLPDARVNHYQIKVRLQE